MDWDKVKEAAYYQNLDYTNVESTIEGKFKDLKFDIIIGSDVVYWPQSIEPLCNVLDVLFKAHEEKLVFYICYIERSSNVHRDLLAGLKGRQFTIQELG